MSLIKKIKEFFSIQPPQSFAIVDPVEVPFHIQELSKIYPVANLIGSYNLAIGEIKIFQFNPGRKNDRRVGQGHVLNKKRHTETWVHLGNDYFKLIMKVKNERL